MKPFSKLFIIVGVFLLFLVSAVMGINRPADMDTTHINDPQWNAYVNNRATGSGDMTKAVYDTDADDSVDVAEAAGIADSATHLTDGTVDEADLAATNSPTDNYILSYDDATKTFTWVVDATGAGADSTWSWAYVDACLRLGQKADSSGRIVIYWNGVSDSMVIDSAGIHSSDTLVVIDADTIRFDAGGSLILNGDQIKDFTGTGLALSSNALTTTLGTEIDTLEINDAQFNQYVENRDDAGAGGDTCHHARVLADNPGTPTDSAFFKSDTFVVEGMPAMRIGTGDGVLLSRQGMFEFLWRGEEADSGTADSAFATVGWINANDDNDYPGDSVKAAADSLASWGNKVNLATDSISAWTSLINEAKDSLTSWANEVNLATDSISAWTSLINEAKDSLTSWANEVNLATDSISTWTSLINEAKDSLTSWANEVNLATDSISTWTSLINEAKDSLTAWANQVNDNSDDIDELETDTRYLVTIANPNSLWSADSLLIPIDPRTEAAITVTRIEVTCDADPGTELDFDLMWADAYIGNANRAVVDEMNTASGAVSITSGFDDATIAANKCVYIRFNAEPDADILMVSVRVTYTID